MGSFISEKILPKVLAFVNTKAVQALKEGMMLTISPIIVGSIFLILECFPIQAVADFFANTGLAPILDQAYSSTFAVSAIIAAIGIGYNYCKLEGIEPLGGGVVALNAFFLIQPHTSGETTGVFDIGAWAGGKGMVGAIICGLLAGYAYSWFIKKNITIKMPAGVPQGVVNSFAALIPGVVIIGVFDIVFGICRMAFDTTPIELIYTLIQTPLQGLSDSIPGVLATTFLVPFLWFFGVHGSSIVSGVLSGVWMANYMENQTIFESGKELTVANGGHIVTQQFIDNLVNLGGSGCTLGIVIFLLFFAKSATLKSLGKLELGPAIFMINEPLLFGLPIVMNPLMVAPFILAPMVAGMTQYFALALGLAPLYKGIVAPWTTPPIISGLIIGDWRTAVLQVVIMAESFLIYFPFLKKIDADTVISESQAANGDDDDDDW